MQFIVLKTRFLILALLLISAFSSFAQLGNSSSDLVFTPVTPCRIVDTRSAGGMISGNTSRPFKSWGASFTAQGGSATDCGIPQSTNVSAVALNLLVVSPNVAGWIAAWPYGLPQPLVSNLNYIAGAVVANSTLLKVDQTAVNGYWNLYTTSTTHFVADVTGYYTRPVSLGSFECETPSGPFLVLANSSSFATKQCSSGYTLTGGGCDDYSLDSSLVIIKSSQARDNSEAWSCRWENRSATDVTAFVKARCCRIPGR